MPMNPKKNNDKGKAYQSQTRGKKNNFKISQVIDKTLAGVDSE